MSWRLDSTAGAHVWDTEPMSRDDLALRDEEIAWLVDRGHRDYALINGRLARSGHPTNAVGVYTGVNSYAPPGTLANVASLNGEAALWNVALYSPWPANSLLAPSAWELYVQWQTVTVATPANLTINPRVGTFAAGASTTAGIALGADAAITLTASITTNWKTVGTVTVGRIGIPGTNSTVQGEFQTTAKPATTGTGAATINDLYGYTTAAAFDASIASGVVLGMANTVTTINYQVNQIHWLSK